MQAYLSLSPFWPVGDRGAPRPVYAVWRELRNTDLQLDRETLTKAFDGNVGSMKITTMEKLRRLASKWAGREVSFGEIIVVSE